MLLYNSLPHLPSTKGVSGPFQGHLIPGNTMGQEFHARLRAVTEAFGPEQNTSENTAGFPRHMLHLCYILVHIPYLVRIYDLSIFHHGYLYIYIYYILYIYMLHQFGICFCIFWEALNMRRLVHRTTSKVLGG